VKDLTPIVRHLVEETAELEEIKLDWVLARNLASDPNGLPVVVSLSKTADGPSVNEGSTVQTATREDKPTEDTATPEIF
jgi:hypothetical protein